MPEREVRRVLVARRRLRVGPHRLGPLLGHSRSTVYGVLRRHGVSRLAHADRLTGVPVRYVRERPGELIHVDVKRLGRVPPGGGHRMLGEDARKHVGAGYDYLHVAIDDATRVAYVAVRPDEQAASTVSFIEEAVAFFAGQGVRVERVMTDIQTRWAFASPRSAGHGRMRGSGSRPPSLSDRAERSSTPGLLITLADGATAGGRIALLGTW